MEPVNLNPPDPADHRLEELLRTSTPAPLPDAGFTHRVLAALPPARRTAPRQWLRPVILTVSALAGVTVVVQQGWGWSDLATAGTQSLQSLSDLSFFLADPWIAVAVGITAISLIIAFAPAEESGG